MTTIEASKVMRNPTIITENNVMQSLNPARVCRSGVAFMASPATIPFVGSQASTPCSGPSKVGASRSDFFMTVWERGLMEYPFDLIQAYSCGCIYDLNLALIVASPCA